MTVPIMSKNEMEKMIEDELVHIPYINGNLPQNLLRSTYHSTRLHGLTNGSTKEEAVSSCIESLKKQYSTWQPIYDKSFFNL